MNSKSIEQLVKQVESVFIGSGTDYPSTFEASGGKNGVLQILETLLDDDGINTGDCDEFEGTLLDVIKCAAAEGGKFGYIDIEGLTAAEAAFVLSDPKFIEAATEIASADGDLNINGVNYELRTGTFTEFTIES